MTNETNRAREEAAVRACIDGWAKALAARNVDALMSHYTPDIRAFDLAPPLQHEGDAYRRNFAEWFKTFRGPIGLEIRDLKIIVGEDVAFSHSLNRLSGERTTGERTDIWVRVTICFRKNGGRWLASHEHVSVPFYMDGTFRAAVDLRP